MRFADALKDESADAFGGDGGMGRWKDGKESFVVNIEGGIMFAQS
jgi:hypothetical protein